MFSFAKNDRGIRLISSAIIFLPVAALVLTMSKSSVLVTAVALGWCVFACVSLIAFLYERSEEEEEENRD